jgi:hypothetical protein
VNCNNISVTQDYNLIILAYWLFLFYVNFIHLHDKLDYQLIIIEFQEHKKIKTDKTNINKNTAGGSGGSRCNGNNCSSNSSNNNNNNS